MHDWLVPKWCACVHVLLGVTKSRYTVTNPMSIFSLAPVQRDALTAHMSHACGIVLLHDCRFFIIQVIDQMREISRQHSDEEVVLRQELDVAIKVLYVSATVGYHGVFALTLAVGVEISISSTCRSIASADPGALALTRVTCHAVFLHSRARGCHVGARSCENVTYNLANICFSQLRKYADSEGLMRAPSRHIQYGSYQLRIILLSLFRLV